MRTIPLALAATALCLSGCYKPDAPAAGDLYGQGPGSHGRYTGIGIYRPDQTWSQIAVAETPKAPQAAGAEAPKASAAGNATLKDDDEVIVVVDTKTGELRQCGNLSGFCVGMNPWAKPLGASQNAPLTLTKHAEELEAEAAARAKAEADTNNRALVRAEAAAKRQAEAKGAPAGPPGAE